MQRALRCLGLILFAGVFCNVHGQGFGSISVSLTHNRPFGDFAAVDANSISGFAKPGLGLTIGGSFQSQGEFLNVGLASEFRSGWQGVQHGLLEQYMEDSYDLPQAYQSEYTNQRKRWGLYSLLAGPLFAWHNGPLVLEARFLIGRLDTGNPYYTVDNGNYIPRGWSKFFINEDNETPWSSRRWNFAYSPKLSLLIPMGESFGWRLEGSMLMSKVTQEMEVIDVVEENGGYVFQRRQERFHQRVRLWSVGIGIYANFY